MKLKYLIILLIIGLITNHSYGNTNRILLKNNLLKAPHAKKYQWYFNGVKLNGVNSSEAIAVKSGNYTVKYETNNGKVETRSVKVNLKSTNKIQRIHLVGDSIMADYSIRSNYIEKYYPVTGWGEKFPVFMCKDSLYKVNHFIDADSIQVINYAMGGRSTKVFYEEGRWATVYNAIQPGDYVFIQFGHNDAAVDYPDRYVDTAGFKNYLRIFINQTREKEGIPVLLTPINRNYPWSGGVLKSVHGDYPLAMKQVADEERVALIDGTQRSCDFFTQKGKDFVTTNYFMNLPAGVYVAYPDGEDDNTHFQPKGALEVARMVFDGLQDLRNLEVSLSDSLAGKVEGGRWYDTKYNSTVTLKAWPKFGWVFTGWSGGITSTKNPLEVNLDKNISVVANFEKTNKTQYYLNTSVEGSGSIEILPFGGLYEEGENIKCEAKAADKYKFFSWVGDKTDTIASLSFNITKQTQLTAVFIEENAVVFQSDDASLTNCILTSGVNNQTGENCIKVSKTAESTIEYAVIPVEDAYLKFNYRYLNLSDNNVYAELYVNDELKEGSLKFAYNEKWQYSKYIGQALKYKENTIKLIFKNPENEIYINFLKITGGNGFADSLTSINNNERIYQFNIYPNPVYSNASITFNLKSNSNVQVELINLHGQILNTVFQQNLNAGNHIINMEKGSLTSGVYACRLKIDNSYIVQKILIQ